MASPYRVEFYELDNLEKKVARCKLDEHGKLVRDADGNKVTELVEARAKNHKHTFRFLDEAGEVVFSPLLRLASREHAERVAARFARNLQRLKTFARQYANDEIAAELSPIEFPKGVI